MQKLEDLADTVSILTQEKLYFDFTEEGHLGLFLSLKEKQMVETKDFSSLQNEIAKAV